MSDVYLQNEITGAFVLQTFLAPMSQVFPAEDDVNKHVDDNCKCLH